jgi:CheY-like chemotaxis protein
MASVAAMELPAVLRARSANERLNIALVGVGGRGADNLHGVEGENIVALCDVDEQRAAASGCSSDVARHLRAIFGDRVRLIALTANSSEDDHLRCLQAGFDLHLVKPADPNEVRRLLEQLADVLRVAGQV